MTWNENIQGEKGSLAKPMSLYLPFKTDLRRHSKLQSQGEISTFYIEPDYAPENLF